jgi:hypothetical protein
LFALPSSYHFDICGASAYNPIRLHSCTNNRVSTGKRQLEAIVNAILGLFQRAGAPAMRETPAIERRALAHGGIDAILGESATTEEWDGVARRSA